MSKLFVQLSQEDCSYLLSLIANMDSGTDYTEKQRGYTVPKLERIWKDPDNHRLAFQDVDYLLELLEDEESAIREYQLEDPQEQQREMTRSQLLAIQELQRKQKETFTSVRKQREARIAKRAPSEALQAHFARTTA